MILIDINNQANHARAERSVQAGTATWQGRKVFAMAEEDKLRSVKVLVEVNRTEAGRKVADAVWVYARSLSIEEAS